MFCGRWDICYGWNKNMVEVNFYWRFATGMWKYCEIFQIPITTFNILHNTSSFQSLCSCSRDFIGIITLPSSLNGLYTQIHLQDLGTMLVMCNYTEFITDNTDETLHIAYVQLLLSAVGSNGAYNVSVQSLRWLSSSTAYHYPSLEIVKWLVSETVLCYYHHVAKVLL